MSAAAAGAPSVHRRHQVCQTCFRASSSFAKKLRLGSDPSEQAYNLEQCLACSQRARTRAASETRLPEEDTGEGAESLQLRPRRLFLKDASPPVAPPPTDEVAGALDSHLDLNSARVGVESDECPPEPAPSSPAAVHALPVQAHTLPAVTPWRPLAPAVPPTLGAPGSACRCKSGDLQRPRPRSGGSPSAPPHENPHDMATHGEDHGAATASSSLWMPSDADGWWSPPASRGAPPEAPPPAPADGKQALRRGSKASESDLTALTSGFCGIALGKRRHEERV